MYSTYFLFPQSTAEPNEPLNEANEPLLKYMNSTLQRAYQFFHCRAKQAGSFGKWLKVALHSVVVFKESLQCLAAKISHVHCKMTSARKLGSDKQQETCSLAH